MEKQHLDILKAYLSEEEIKAIVIEEYRNAIYEEIKSIAPNKRMENHERILTNAIWYYIENECDKIMGVNTKELIEGHVKRILTQGSFDHSIFRDKSAWSTEEGIGTKILKDSVLANKDLITEKVKSLIDAMEIDKIKEDLIEVMIEIVRRKFETNPSGDR